MHPQFTPRIHLCCGNGCRNGLNVPGWIFALSTADISEVYAAYQDMLAKWRELPVGVKLDLRW
jgi:hypothetical protein